MKIKSFDEAKTYLEGFIRLTPQRYSIIPSGKKITPLDKMRYFLSLLGNPQDQFPSVVVSGTAGKGSTTYFIAHMLQEAGYRTGMKISPHLQIVNERIQINDAMISNEDFISLINEIQPAITQMQTGEYGEPSHAQIIMAMTFLYFAKQKIDIGIIEVGLESSYDPTNVLHPLVFVLTNIGLDHTDFLGDSIQKIAHESTSAIKNASPTTLSILGKKRTIASPVVVTAVSQPEMMEIVKNACKQSSSPLLCFGIDFHIEHVSSTRNGSIFNFTTGDRIIKQLSLSLVGEYQVQNAAIAVTVLKQLKRYGFLITQGQMKKTLSNAVFPGRFEMTKANILFDVAHNPMKMQAFIGALEKFYPDKKKVFLIAFKQSKDIRSMLELIISIASEIIVTQFCVVEDPSKNFSMKPEEIYSVIRNIKGSRQCTVTVIQDTRTAYRELLRRLTQENVLGIVTGSLYLVGEVKNFQYRLLL